MLFRTVLAALTVSSLSAAAWAVPGAAAVPDQQPASSASLRCVDAGQAPQRARAAFGDPSKLARAAGRSGRSGAALVRVADRDGSLWVDGCGQPFYAEPFPSARTLARAEAGQAALARDVSAAAQAPSAGEVFSLESRPGAPHTIYLDFTGHTVSGSAWNDTYTAGASIVAPPYSADADVSTAFSAVELANIAEAWGVVSEDYAPFNVNVTTREPAGVFSGSRVVVTADASGMSAQCRCAGLGYLNVFGYGSGSSYQPAWVFTDRSTTYGTYIGDIASHEVGHNMGLNHDGDAGSPYHAGGDPWAPIMGSAYLQPLAQWSAGEYAGATNVEDDVAVIASRLGRVTDDHADGRVGASRLVSGVPVSGVVSTDSDVDVFEFVVPGGTTRVDVVGARQFRETNLDVRVVVRDASGAVVASADPVSSRSPAGAAAGVSASVSAVLAAGAYTVSVAGVGAGDPRVRGGYSGYGSLGRYTVSLTAASQVLSAAGAAVSATVGSAVLVAPVKVSGGVAPYRFAVSALPPGMVFDAVSGELSGTASQTGSFSVQVTVRDAVGDAVVVTVPVSVSSALSWVTAARLPGGRVGSSYAATIRVTGGAGAPVWSVSGLPAGLRVVRKASALRVVGTPRKAGSFSVTVSAASGGVSVSRVFRLRVTR